MLGALIVVLCRPGDGPGLSETLRQESKDLGADEGLPADGPNSPLMASSWGVSRITSYDSTVLRTVEAKELTPLSRRSQALPASETLLQRTQRQERDIDAAVGRFSRSDGRPKIARWAEQGLALAESASVQRLQAHENCRQTASGVSHSRQSAARERMAARVVPARPEPWFLFGPPPAQASLRERRHEAPGSAAAAPSRGRSLRRVI